MPIRVIAKEGRDKSKSRMRGPRDEVYSDKEGRFKRDPKTRARKPMMGGGLMGKKKEKDKPEKPRDKRKPIDPINQKKLEDKFKKKVRDQENKKEPARKDSLREKIKPKKKMDRLQQLREELNKMKKGGKVKKKFPDLTGDGKVTQADILKGRGVFKKGGASK